MNNVTVRDAECIRCHACVEVCPRGTMRQDSPTSLPYADPDGPCTVCGHCAAHCPTAAIDLHTPDWPAAPYDEPSQGISPQELGNYLCTRRSVRAYRPDTVTRETLQKLFDVVRYAPTGINRQLIRWIVIYKPGEVRRLAGMAVEWLREFADKNPEAAPRYAPLITAWDNGHDAICRGAPHLAIALTPKDYGLSHTDAVIALSYFEVAAPAFGIGTCWAGYMDMVINSSPALQKELNIHPQDTALGALLFGYPARRLFRLPKRKAAEIEWR